MQRHQENAIEIANWLKTNPAVKTVYFPGLESDAGYEVQKR